MRENFNPALYVASLSPKQKQELQRYLVMPGRYYGDGGTIHNSDKVDVIVDKGQVKAVWFRCSLLPFKQVGPGAGEGNPEDVGISGIIFSEPGT